MIRCLVVSEDVQVSGEMLRIAFKAMRECFVSPRPDQVVTYYGRHVVKFFVLPGSSMILFILVDIKQEEF